MTKQISKTPSETFFEAKTLIEEQNEEQHETQHKTQETFYQIYDRIIKRIITLSPNAVINLINGLFQTNYPPGSKITYNWTEHHDNNLKRTLADTILTINDQYTYHIEAQAYKDEAIEFRVFDYSYKHALITRNYKNVLRFPEPKIVYLYSGKNLPDEEIITLDFGTQGTFDYHVPVYKLMERSPQELDEQNMIILIPFMILRLRKQLEKSRSKEDINDLKSLIFDDILGLIKKNLRAGNVTAEDANQLWSMVVALYRYLYAKYVEFEKEGLNMDMNDELILDFDLIKEKIRQNLKAEVKAEVREEIETEVREEVKTKIWEEVETEVREEIETEVREEVKTEVREEVKTEVREEVTAQDQLAIIQKLYSKLNDSEQVALLLDLPLETILAAI